MPALALLPLRFFLGGMFLYAGVDKLVDPGFLQATGPGSIGEQLLAFERVSPLAPLIHLVGDPLPVFVGLGIALLEIAIGLGALLGIAYRWVAVAGAAVSILFFLTASWSTRPLYLGADLPYAVAWATLALAGHGGLWVLEGRMAWALGSSTNPSTRSQRPALGPAAPRPGRVPAGRTLLVEREVDPDRRRLLELGVLASATIAVAALVQALPLPRSAAAVSGGTANAAGSATADPGAAPPGASRSATDATGGTVVASVEQVEQRGIVGFRDPASGDPAVLMKLQDGRIVAYDAVCTHEGCSVGYDRGSGLLVCPCHGAAFDPEHDAEVVGGPTNRPLPSLPIRIDQTTGRIYLQA